MLWAVLAAHNHPMPTRESPPFCYLSRDFSSGAAWPWPVQRSSSKMAPWVALPWSQAAAALQPPTLPRAEPPARKHCGGALRLSPPGGSIISAYGCGSMDRVLSVPSVDRTPHLRPPHERWKFGTLHLTPPPHRGLCAHPLPQVRIEIPLRGPVAARIALLCWTGCGCP